MRRLLSLICFIYAFFAGPPAALADRPVALVIGNSKYAGSDDILVNPRNDADAMANSLAEIGFDVVKGLDLDLVGMHQMLAQFLQKAATAKVAVVFYAGHAAQVEGRNYLIPVDAKVVTHADPRVTTATFKLASYELDKLLDSLDHPSRANIIIIDACRNNPLERSFAGRARATSLGRWLAPYSALSSGTLIAFATAPGRVALDGTGETNSPFTRGLLKHLKTPGLEVRQMLTKARAEVMAATSNQQVPWDNSSLIGDVYLAGSPKMAEPSPPRSPEPAVNRCAEAGVHFRSAESIGTRAVLEDHLKHFANCAFAALAQARIDALDKARTDSTKLAVVAPPVAPPRTAAPIKPVIGVYPADAPLTAERERALRPKDAFRECEECPEMVLVPAGSFMKGSPANEKGRFGWEGPQRRSAIQTPFAVGKFEITFAQWDACVAAGGCGLHRPSDEGWGRSNRPVINVSWNDAKKYLGWLSSRTGKQYRLLTESEWEYAARANSSTRYHFGDDEKEVCKYGNGPDRSVARPADWQLLPCNDAFANTAPVGSFDGNEFGLFDMLGNVWEWTEDCWNDNYGSAPTDGSAWVGGDCSRRILRGGAWHQHARDLRSARRYRDSLDARSIGIGFRVARTTALATSAEQPRQTRVIVQEAAATPPALLTRPSISVAQLTAERERALKPKDKFRECDNCPEMVVVPPGSFAMGSPKSETGRLSLEDPQHNVVIARPFAVGRFAVTFGEWDACVADGGCDGYVPLDESWGRGRMPVVNVSWHNAKAYVSWLSNRTGKHYRLLSEAEREYVTRAGTATPFWWGSSISASQANYDGRKRYGAGPKSDFHEKPVPVESFKPNPWDLYQVHGNVWEWVEDCWNGSYKGAPNDGSAWTSGDCSRRILRGGGWSQEARYLRSGRRNTDLSDGRENHTGFRVARTLGR